MLHEFLTANRQVLITRCREKVAKRIAPPLGDAELQHGIPLFLDQLVKTLQLEQTLTPLDSRKVSGPSEPGKTRVFSEIGTTAAKHGNELLQRGFTVDQVVHDYGDLCQAITELAVEENAPVTTDEFRTLNRCLDNAIADAVTEFGRQRDNLISTKGAHAMGERLGYLAHELRNLLDSAMLAVAAIKSGDVGMAGATGAVLDRSLTGLRDVIDRSLADVRLAVAMPAQRERIDLAEFVAEVQVAGMLEARARRCTLTVTPVEPGLAVDADRQMLSSAIANLLQNAFKFTRRHTDVSLRAYGTPDNRALIEIEDACGGLPQGTADKLFRPFEQHATDRTGLGLGLSITQRSIEANGGVVQVRDKPGTGCVFIIDLPLARNRRVEPAT
jgi:signal transduction histidine kinase